MSVKLSITYRVLGVSAINPEEIMRCAGVYEQMAAQSRLLPGETTLTERYVSIATRELASYADLGEEITQFAIFCKREFDVLFKRKDLAVHELYGAIFQPHAPAELLWIKAEDFGKLHGLGIALNFYPPDQVKHT